MEPVVVLVTASSADEAARLARTLVDERLAACVNIVPAIRSRYWWKGRVEEADEVLLIAKSARHLVDDLTARVMALHPYSTPEVIALPVIGGSPAYLAWLESEVGGARSRPAVEPPAPATPANG